MFNKEKISKLKTVICGHQGCGMATIANAIGYYYYRTNLIQTVEAIPCKRPHERVFGFETLHDETPEIECSWLATSQLHELPEDCKVYYIMREPLSYCISSYRLWDDPGYRRLENPYYKYMMLDNTTELSLHDNLKSYLKHTSPLEQMLDHWFRVQSLPPHVKVVTMEEIFSFEGVWGEWNETFWKSIDNGALANLIDKALWFFGDCERPDYCWDVRMPENSKSSFFQREHSMRSLSKELSTQNLVADGGLLLHDAIDYYWSHTANKMATRKKPRV